MQDYTIIFSTRNNAQTIERVLNSMVNQTWKPKKIVAVDDGSQDGTGDIIDGMVKTFPDLITVIHTNNRGYDISRLPLNWNAGLRDVSRLNTKYHMIGAGDCELCLDYAQLILSKMSSDNVIIASGSYGDSPFRAPLGAGRFVNNAFFNSHYPKGYPYIIGYESEILESAITLGYRIKTYNEVKLIHHQRLGAKHNFKEFGYSMKSLGYYPPYALGRCILSLGDRRIGFFGALKMLYYYVTFEPEVTGYYTKWPRQICEPISNRQKKMITEIFKKRSKVYIRERVY